MDYEMSRLIEYSSSELVMFELYPFIMIIQRTLFNFDSSETFEFQSKAQIHSKLYS